MTGSRPWTVCACLPDRSGRIELTPLELHLKPDRIALETRRNYTRKSNGQLYPAIPDGIAFEDRTGTYQVSGVSGTPQPEIGTILLQIP